MAKCSKCQGTGYDEYDEDGRWVRDACYHCGTTGYVDEVMDYNDRLMNVVRALATIQEAEYRREVNSDPEGEGYNFLAAENGVTEQDYFIEGVWSREPGITIKLQQMSKPEQELLLAWNEYNHE